ncbi:MAG TPA: hypothetical protein HA366_05145, partial [Candidatus Methanomethylophilaceae archaeon]|nr:hypothetical protein [Candidatus Methanomethylophilaceae archaeon]
MSRNDSVSILTTLLAVTIGNHTKISRGVPSLQLRECFDPKDIIHEVMAFIARNAIPTVGTTMKATVVMEVISMKFDAVPMTISARPINESPLPTDLASPS